MARTGTGIRPHNRCVATVRRTGLRCRAAKVTLKDVRDGSLVRYRVCLGHLIQLGDRDQIKARHGFDARDGNGGGRPPKPTVIEVLHQMVEKEYGLRDVLAPFFKGLEAERALVVGNGPHATVQYTDDPELQLKAAQAILDRLYGKPKQTTELTGAGGGPVAVNVPTDAEREQAVAELVARYGAIGAPAVVTDGSQNGSSNGR